MRTLPSIFWRCPRCLSLDSMRVQVGLLKPSILKCTQCGSAWTVKPPRMTLIEPGVREVVETPGDTSHIDYWFRLVQGSPLPLTAVGSVPALLRKGEMAYLYHSLAILHREKAVRHYQGENTGVSVRVARGVYLRSGGHRGTAVTQKVLSEDDRGHLTLTNQRLLFGGRTRSIEVDLRKVLQVERGDGLLRVSHGQRVVLLSVPGGSLEKWEIYVRSFAKLSQTGS